jgi:predicted HTH transcriptional regulator
LPLQRPRRLLQPLPLYFVPTAARKRPQTSASAPILINADYYESRGVVIVKTKNGITISNPGGFRIDLDEAKSGGISDPRNTTLIKMFNLINIGERAGSGIPNIYNVWKKQGWQEPRIAESLEPARIMMTLPTAAKPLIKTVDRKITEKTRQQRDAVIEYLTVHITAKNTDLAELLGLKPTRIRELLAGLIEDQIVVAEGEKKSRIYKLKEKASM